MNHIALIGDSIFDNASYVGKGESVTEILSGLLDGKGTVKLLAVDGDITTDVSEQLKSFPPNITHAFVSCGGNDALRMVNILDKEVATVGDALDALVMVRENFRANYRNMLLEIANVVERIGVCTVYNSVPGTSEKALAALALFNEIILQEAISLKLPIIDLRIICSEPDDYSSVSPIEPSGQGAEKIARTIISALEMHRFESRISATYV